MTRAALYVRLSKLDGREVQDSSIPRQERDCRTYADLRGWQAVGVYEDVDTSAYRKVRRPGFDRLLADVEAGLVDVILVWKLDRLLRRAAEFERVWSVCEAAGANLASVHDSLDTTHETGRAIARILVAMAQLESEQMSLRIKSAKADRRAAGFARSGGPRPFGLTEGWKEVVPEEAALVREAADRVLAGRSLRGICLDWNARGVATTTGGTWTSAALRGLLLQDRLCPEGNQRWPALLDEGTCRRLRAVLLDPSRRAPTAGRGRRPNLLTGLVRCGHPDCQGAAMKASQPKGGKRKYACPPRPWGCGRLSVLAEPLEDFVVRAALTALDTPALAEMAADPADDPLARVAQLEAELAEVARLKGEGQLSFAEWQEMRGPLSRRLADAQADLAEGELRRSVPAVLVGQWDDLELGERRRVLQAVLERAVVSPARRKGPGTPIEERVDLVWRV